MSVFRSPSSERTWARAWARYAAALLIAAGFLRALATAASADINATVTADNAYSFGWGDANGVGPSFGGGTYVGASISPDNSLLFKDCPGGPGPNAYGVETYSIPAPKVLPGNHLYVAAFSDDSDRQGLLGTFLDTVSNVQIYTGDTRWQVCATGENYQGNELTEGIADGVPSLATINARIADCNAWTAAGGSGPATTSGGWVDSSIDYGLGKIYRGNHNDGSAPKWGAITCIPSTAQWMWFNSQPGVIADPTGAGGNHKEFLIFRLDMKVFQPPCPRVFEPLVECIQGPLGPTGCYNVTVIVSNTSTAPVNSILVQGHAATPSVISLNPPLAPGDTRPVEVMICPDQSVIAGGSASLTFIFPGTFGCCRQEVSFELPPCPGDPCINIPRYSAACVPGDSNAIDLTIELDPPPGGGGVLHIGGGIVPDMIPLPLGNTNLVIGPLHIDNAPGPIHDTTTGVVTRRWCTTLYTTSDGEEGACCQRRACFELPTCGLPATPVASEPVGTPATPLEQGNSDGGRQE